MRIVRVVSELDFGGVEQVLANSVPLLVKGHGLNVVVIVLGKGGRVSQYLLGENMDVRVLGHNPQIPSVKLLCGLTQIFREIQPDVVHCQGAEANFHGIWAAKLASVPLIIGEEIGIPNHHTVWKYIFKWIYKKANVVIAISEAVKETIVNLGEVEVGKVKVVYNPVDCPDSYPDQLSVISYPLPTKNADRVFRFVSTCRLVPIKNLDRLLEAFVGLVKANPDRNMRIEIVGDGPERENLELKIQQLELGNQVKLVGFQQDIWPFLFKADAFILPSLREGSSVSLAEAMTAGLPSILTKVGGASEILGNSQSGILIDPLNTSEIQAAMQQLIDLSPSQTQTMGAKAKEEAKRFSTEQYSDTLMSIYNHI